MNYGHWTMVSSPLNVIEICQQLNKKPVYLSPEAQNELTEIDPEAAYIMGGLVDRTVIKRASYNRAR